jgi:hypothetical protein
MKDDPELVGGSVAHWPVRRWSLPPCRPGAMNDEWMMAGNHANASHACMKAQDPVPQLQQKAGDPLLCLLAQDFG